MKTTEQLAVHRMLTEVQLRAITELSIGRPIRGRFARLMALHAALTAELNARLDGRFLVEVAA